jgi:hypothetical protein
MRAACSLFLLLLLIALSSGAMPSSSTPSRIPISDDERALELVLRDLLSNPELQSVRDQKGTAGDHTVELFGWPREFIPNVPGWTIRHGDIATVADWKTCRLLGIRLLTFDRSEQPAEDYDDPCSGPITTTLFNAGGTKNGT